MSRWAVGVVRKVRALGDRLHSLLFMTKYFMHVQGASNVVVRRGAWVRQREGASLLKIIFSGRNRIGEYTLFQGAGVIRFGRRSFCGRSCTIGCNESVTIGKNVMIADMVTIRDTNHRFDDISIPMVEQGISTASVIIKDNVWIGYGAAILAGVTVGEGAIVAAGAVVTRDVKDFSIVGGVPARPISHRSDGQIVERP